MNKTALIYGNSLFELAVNENKEEIIFNQLSEINNIIFENKELIKLMDAPCVSKIEKTEILDEAFGEKIDIYILNFLKILAENKTFNTIFDCITAYNLQYNKKFKIINAKVTSACDLSDELKEKLKNKLSKITGMNVKLDCKTNPDLIGGLIIDFDNQRMDYSVKSKLNEIKEIITSRKD